MSISMKNLIQFSIKISTKVLFIFIILLSSTSAEIEFKEVEATGVDKIYEIALKKAFKQAIEKVNGISIKSENIYKTIDANLSIKGNLSINDQTSSGEYKSTANYNELTKTIFEKSEGSIRSFEILNEYKNTDGEFYIKIIAKIAEYKLSEVAKRKRIAIIPFRLEKNNFLNQSNSFNANDLINLINNDLTSYFVQTRKFTVLDRKFNKEIFDELSNLKNTKKIEERVKIGQKLFADFILIGEIYSFKIEEKEKKFLTSDTVIKKRIGSMVLNYRILDVATNQIIYSDDYEKELDLSKISKKLKYFTNLVVEEIGPNIIDEIFPIMVENFDDNLLYLSQGGKNIKLGDRFTLYKLTNKKIIDSYTGENLGNIKKEIGLVEIIETNSGYSIAKFVDSSQIIKIDFKPLTFTLKPFRQTSKKNKENKKIKKKDKNLDKVY